MDKPNSRIIEQRLERIIEEQRLTLKGFNRKMEQLQEENHKLREERDELLTVDSQRDRKYHEDGEMIDDLKMQLQSAQQEIESLRRQLTKEACTNSQNVLREQN